MASLKDVIIISAGGHGRSTLDVFREAGNFAIAGFLDDFLPTGTRIFNIPVLGSFDEVGKFAASYDFVVGRGKIAQSTERKELAERCWSAGGKLVAEMSPLAYVSGFSALGEGTVIHHGATVNIGVEVGRNCIINSHALVDHDTQIGDHSHVATGAIVNGGCVIGENSFIGSGAIIFQGVVLPAGTVVPAGAAVKRSLGDTVPKGSRRV